jgi:NADH dehydrogenase FAD-containing subunit
VKKHDASPDQKIRIAKFCHLPSTVDVLVIGAGPTGLGAAKRLNHLVRQSLPVTLSIECFADLEDARMGLLG